MRIKHRIKHSPFSEWRYRIACVSSYATFILLLISFVTPYWLQSWPRLHTPFLRLGLWEFCMNGYVQRLDSDMISYYGCWWILSPYFQNIFTNLVPFWFMIIQILVSIALCLQIIIGITLTAYLCERIRHVERRVFFISMITFGHAACSCLLFISAVIFGINYQNQIWMPYPKLNWPSWSFGLAILAGFTALLCAISFGLIDRELRRDIQTWVLDFPMSTKVKQRRRWKLRKSHWPEEITTNSADIPKSSQYPYAHSDLNETNSEFGKRNEQQSQNSDNNNNENFTQSYDENTSHTDPIIDPQSNNNYAPSNLSGGYRSDMPEDSDI